MIARGLYLLNNDSTINIGPWVEHTQHKKSNKNLKKKQGANNNFYNRLPKIELRTNRYSLTYKERQSLNVSKKTIEIDKKSPRSSMKKTMLRMRPMNASVLNFNRYGEQMINTHRIQPTETDYSTLQHEVSRVVLGQQREDLEKINRNTILVNQKNLKKSMNYEASKKRSLNYFIKQLNINKQYLSLPKKELKG